MKNEKSPYKKFNNKIMATIPVITFISGTLSGDKSIILGFLSKASRRILFLVAEPQSLYTPRQEQINLHFSKIKYNNVIN